MKIIVNSKNLFEALKEAEKNDAYYVTELNNSVVFQALALNDVATYSYGMICHIKYKSSFQLDRVAAYRLKCFVKGLDEQPITVEFMDDQINVSCEKIFRL